MGETRRHCGHCKSSNTTIATCDPLGGRNTESVVSAAVAPKPAARMKSNVHRTEKRDRNVFVISKNYFKNLMGENLCKTFSDFNGNRSAARMSGLSKSSCLSVGWFPLV